jgi:uncharacterized membrane protein
VTYWDYSHDFLNIQGRVCLRSLLSFGALGLLVIYVIAPFADAMLQRLSVKARLRVLIVLALCFAADIVCSILFPHVGKGLTYDN